MTPYDVRAVIDDLAASQAPATVRRNVASLKAMFNAAVAEDLIPRTPVRGVRLPRIEPKAQPELTVADLLRLVDARARPISSRRAAGRRGRPPLGRDRRVCGWQTSTSSAARFTSAASWPSSPALTVQETKSDRGNRSLAAPTFVIEALAVHIQQFRPLELVRVN